MQTQNLRKKGKVKPLNDFQNNVPSDTKCHCYLTGNEEIKDLRYEWFKDAVSRQMIINGQLSLVREGP